MIRVVLLFIEKSPYSVSGERFPFPNEPPFIHSQNARALRQGHCCPKQPFVQLYQSIGYAVGCATAQPFWQEGRAWQARGGSTGAGDAFVGSFAFFLSKDKGLHDAIKGASKIASISVLAAGTQTSFPEAKDLSPETLL